MKGEFRRRESQFRNWVTSDGAPGIGGDGGFKAEAGRYHLYISHACPWAHRTMIFRKLKGLEDIISVSVVNPLMPDESWVFAEYPGATLDDVNHKNYLHEVYEFAQTDYNGHIKNHYYRSHTSINPTGIVPRGPVLDFYSPHQRNNFIGDIK